MDYKEFIASRRKRDDSMKALRAKGWTLDKLAAQFRVTKQRVSQICKNGNGKSKRALTNVSQ